MSIKDYWSCPISSALLYCGFFKAASILDQKVSLNEENTQPAKIIIPTRGVRRQTNLMAEASLNVDLNRGF